MNRTMRSTVKENSNQHTPNTRWSRCWSQLSATKQLLYKCSRTLLRKRGGSHQPNKHYKKEPYWTRHNTKIYSLKWKIHLAGLTADYRPLKNWSKPNDLVWRSDWKEKKLMNKEPQWAMIQHHSLSLTPGKLESQKESKETYAEKHMWK